MTQKDGAITVCGTNGKNIIGRKGMPKTREDFLLDSGLVDDFDGATVRAKFDVREDYSRASSTTDPMLILTLESPDLEQPVEQAWSIGGSKQWQAIDGGKSVVSGKKADSHQFNMSSRGGEVVSRMFELVGGGSKDKGIEFFIARGHYMTEAAFYEGLNWHWKREKKKTVSGEERDVLMPVAYLGEIAAKAGPKAVDTSTLDTIVVELAPGKDDRGLKVAALKHDILKKPENATYMKDLINGPKIVNLTTSGLLVKGPDGKFV